MRNFYMAETCAFQPEVVINFFAFVGLQPFNPKLILANCRNFFPVVPQPNCKDYINSFAVAIKRCMGE